MRTPLLAAFLLTASVVSSLGEIYAYWEYDDPAGTGFWEAENSASDVEFPRAFANKSTVSIDRWAVGDDLSEIRALSKTFIYR